jgi:hypothetical protein
VGEFRYFKIPHQKCSFLDFGRIRVAARGSGPFHFPENEQKRWGNFVYENSPTFFGGFQALIQPDFRRIAFFAVSMPCKHIFCEKLAELTGKSVNITDKFNLPLICFGGMLLPGTSCTQHRSYCENDLPTDH